MSASAGAATEWWAVGYRSARFSPEAFWGPDSFRVGRLRPPQGLSQGHVAAIDDISAKLRYDFYYVRHISLWLDLLIVRKALRIIAGGFGTK